MAVDTKTMSVLLIDDDMITCNLFQLVFEQTDFKLEIMNSGMAGLDYLQHQQPDVIVIDIFLPDVDGYRTLETIKQRNLAPAASYIATTAYYTNDTRSEVIAHGFDNYMTKPIDVSGLVSFLQSAAQAKAEKPASP
jgi:CheY-like chemotaxis protein